MTLSAGTRLGPYEITAEIGAGGMGVVYRARDTRLNRDVALKVLPELFALDPDRLGRFKREAQVLASLNHPHIAAIHGLEESEGVHALVLEYVDGPTASRTGRFRSTKRCSSPGRLLRHSRPRTNRGSSIAT
jgi:serine/threonine protein kinase